MLVVVALVSHPKAQIAGRWSESGTVRVAAAKQERRSAADFALDKAAGDAWDSPGSYLFDCEPTCPELLVALTVNGGSLLNLSLLVMAGDKRSPTNEDDDPPLCPPLTAGWL